MSDWLERLVDDYYRWLREETEIVREDDGRVVISTPFLGMFNDAIEVYIRRNKDGKILLSDGGDTLRNLAVTQGRDVLRDKRLSEFTEAVLLSNGARLDRKSGELLVDADESDFPQKKHGLVSAMLEMHGMGTAAHLSLRESEIGSVTFQNQGATKLALDEGTIFSFDLAGVQRNLEEASHRGMLSHRLGAHGGLLSVAASNLIVDSQESKFPQKTHGRESIVAAKLGIGNSVAHAPQRWNQMRDDRESMAQFDISEERMAKFFSDPPGILRGQRNIVHTDTSKWPVANENFADDKAMPVLENPAA